VAVALAVSAGDTAEDAARHPWGRVVRRAGWAAKGVVYAVVSVLAVQIAAGNGAGQATAQGAFRAIGSRPFGTLALTVVAVGLVAFAVDRLLAATVLATDDHSGLRRVATAVNGLAYLALAVLAASSIGAGGGSSGNPQGATASVMAWPAGPWLVGALGVGLVVFAVSEGRHAARRDATNNLKLSRFSASTRRVIAVGEAVGIAGHGLAFALIGYFLIQSAVTHDPSRAESLDGALQRFAGEPFGTVVVGATALGLAAYGVHCFVQAVWRRMAS